MKIVKPQFFLDGDEFWNWLDSFPGEQVVGTSNSWSYDPVANFLKYKYKVNNVKVQPNEVAIYDYENVPITLIETEWWLREFVAEIDQIHDWSDKLKSKPIIASRAIYVLEYILNCNEFPHYYIDEKRWQFNPD